MRGLAKVVLYVGVALMVFGFKSVFRYLDRGGRDYALVGAILVVGGFVFVYIGNALGSRRRR